MEGRQSYLIQQGYCRLRKRAAQTLVEGLQQTVGGWAYQSTQGSIYKAGERRRKGTEAKSLTIIPANRMSNEAFGPDTDRYKQSGENWSNNTNNHNGMLLARGISIDDHF